jgi:hypothetical protein
MRPVPELVCQCGITFEPLLCYDADNDEPLCDECADGRPSALRAITGIPPNGQDQSSASAVRHRPPGA